MKWAQEGFLKKIPRLFYLRERPVGINRALQNMAPSFFCRKGKGSDSQDPPSCAPDGG